MKAAVVAPLTTVQTAAYFAHRNAQLEQGVVKLLTPCVQLTATELRHHLSAGMRELDRVLQSMRTRGLIRSERRRWELVK